MKAEASAPSIGRSLGTRSDAPAIPASVGSQSTAASICSVTKHPHAPLERRVEEIAAPGSIRARAPFVGLSRRLRCRCSNEDRVILDARVLNGIQHLADAVVHLGDDV